MKVLFLNTNIGYGGAEKMMTWVANQMCTYGWDVTFLTYRDVNANYQILNENVRRQHIQLERKGGGILDFFRTSWTLHSYILHEQFDIAIAFLSPSQIRLVQACKGTKTKVLLSHRADPYRKNNLKGLYRLVSRWQKHLFFQANAYVFQTSKAQAYFPEYIQNRSVVIPNPIQPLKRTCERKADKRIVCVARLENVQKRQDLLINAFKKIYPLHPDYTLHFYGSGPDEEMLKELAKDNSHIIFEGVTLNIIEEIQNAAMFVLSSDYEGIPNALLEAMSLGIPCISTDCSPGGASLLIDKANKGIIVECGNVNKLAEAIDTFIRNPELAEKCGRNAMDVNTRFSEKWISEKWINYINYVYEN